MTRRGFLARLDVPAVERAVRAAEEACAIELRVSIAGLFWGRTDRVARRAFQRMGMSSTERRNGVLLLVAPWRRKVVVFADQGITAKVDAELWSSVIAIVTDAFRTGRFTEGLVAALGKLAAVLAAQFPPSARVNELPETIDR
jgi:putative membrane protein